MVSVQVWDTAGQEQFHQITTSYYRNAHAIMVVYDISDIKSLENVEYWIKNIKAHASESVHIGLVGNKTDLRALEGKEVVVDGVKDDEEDEDGHDDVQGAVRKLKRVTLLRDQC